MFRIYFDENEGDEQDRYDLSIPGSLADIEPVADQLAEGENEQVPPSAVK
jgi:hypothetical protein